MTTKVQDMSGNQIVDAMIDKIKADPRWTQLAETYMDDRQWTKIGAVPIAIQSLTTVGFELLAAFPPVNSAPPSKDKHRGPVLHGNVMTDWYPDPSQKKRAKKIKFRCHSIDLAQGIPLGTAIVNEVSAIASADVGESKRTPTGKYAELANKPQELEALKNHWKPRLTNLIRATREAIEICQQLAAIHPCKNVDVRIQTTPVKQARVFVMPNILDDNGKHVAPWRKGTDEAPEYLYATDKPFYVSTIERDDDGRERFVGARGLTVNEFLSWDIEAAGGENATLKSLDDTAKRGKPEPEEDETVVAIKGANEFEDYMDETFMYIDDPNNRKDLAAFMDKAAGTDCLTVTFRMYERLRQFFGSNPALMAKAIEAIKAEEAKGDPADKPVPTDRKVA